MTDLNAAPEGPGAQNPDSFDRVDVPLSTRQLDWVSTKAQSCNHSPASFIRLLIFYYKSISERPGDAESSASVSSSDTEERTQQSADDISTTKDTSGLSAPPSMFDYVE
jgi:hypothetical protein